jgi:hypothetical protein
MDKIQTSLEWQELRVQLEQKINHLDYKIQKDLYIMLKNTDTCVGKLSIEEIQCRRYHRPTGKFLTKLEETNTMIADINKMITMGALL